MLPCVLHPEPPKHMSADWDPASARGFCTLVSKTLKWWRLSVFAVSEMGKEVSHRLVHGLPSFRASSGSTVRMDPDLKPRCSRSTE